MKRSELRAMVLEEMAGMRIHKEEGGPEGGFEAIASKRRKERMEGARQKKIMQAQEQPVTHEAPIDDLAEVTGNSSVDKILGDIFDLMRKWRQAASDSGADPQLLKKYSAAVKAFRKAAM